MFHYLVQALTTAALMALSAAARGEDLTPATQTAAELRAYYSANGLLQRGLHEPAAREYRQFLEAQPSHAKAPVARYGLSICLVRLGKLDEAEPELVRLEKLRKFEYAGEVAVLLGQCRMARQDFAAAAEGLRQFLEQQPEQALAADAMALLIEALYRDGRHAAAVEQARRFGRQLAPALGKRADGGALRERVLLVWAFAHAARSEWAEAAGPLEELLRDFPEAAGAEQAQMLLARCHEQRGTDAEAAKLYAAVMARPNGKQVAEAAVALAGVALRRNDAAEAARLLDGVLKDAPAGGLRCPAVLLRVQAALALNQVAEATKLLAGDLAACESDGQLAYWRAKVALREGRDADAAPLLDKAIEQHRDGPLANAMRYDKALVLERRGEYDAAARLLEPLLELAPEHALAADVLHLAAIVEQQRKNYARSSALCAQWLERYGKNRPAAAVTLLAADNDLLADKAEAAAAAYARYLEQFGAEAGAEHVALRLGSLLCRLGKLAEAVAPLTRAAEAARTDAKLGEARLLLGDLYLQRSEWKAAEQWLTQYLRSGEPAQPDEALLKLGLAQARQGRADAAVATFDELLQKHPKSEHRVQGQFERGQALLALERWAEAEAAFQAIAAGEGADRFAAHIAYHLGTLALRRQAAAEAAAHLAEAVKKSSDDELTAAALAQHGQALLAAGQLAEAEQALSQFAARFPEHAEAKASAARLAVVLARQGKHERALKAIEAGGSWSGLRPALRSAVLYEKCWCLRKLGQQDEALRAYRELLADDAGPQRGFAAVELAELLAGSGQCDEASRVVTEMRSREREFAELPADLQARALYRLGTCALEGGRPGPALEALEQMLKVAPQHELATSAHYFCGEAGLAAKRAAGAVEHFTAVVDAGRDSELYAPALLKLGEALAALEKWPRSEEVFSKYLSEFADGQQWYQAQFGIGWAREHQKRYDEALAAYRKVVEKHTGPTAARAQFQIGECLYAKKEFEAALAEFLKVEILYGQAEWSAAGLYEAGRCLEELGRQSDARKHFESVREKYGQTSWAAMASRRLAQTAAPSLPGKGG